jgi:hypothetical protein
VHNRTDAFRHFWDDHPSAGDTVAATQAMLISSILIALTAAIIIARMGTSDGMNTRQLGWMSEQWLAEHRASNPS